MTLADYLRRIDLQLGKLLDVAAEQPDADAAYGRGYAAGYRAGLDESRARDRATYRRGYLAGHHAMRAGRPCDPDQAEASRRTAG